ncbi:hypothetical protein G2W53_021139 [Senna tora]|uniref:Uncharacterized protein n=1 Tax=Senna tora TaxID=362788 RepID=A0A834WGX6_9FABA|nr:hypothetical protein G2W53_021139 [Senna tora]
MAMAFYKYSSLQLLMMFVAIIVCVIVECSEGRPVYDQMQVIAAMLPKGSVPPSGPSPDIN